jgi:glycosyltransferase involved in cell wall biosynthesis
LIGKKNILFVSSWYPNRLNATLGIFVKRHAQAVALKHNVSAMYVCSDVNTTNKYDIDIQNEEGILTVRVYYKKITSNIPIISSLKKIARNRKAYLLAYAEIIKKFGKPDIVHGNMLVPACVFAYYLFKKYKIPYLVSENWTGFLPSDGNYKGFLMQFFTKRVANNAACLAPVSIDLQNALQSHGFNKPNYQIVPNVVNVNLFIPAEKSRAEKIRAIHVSALDDAQKNISDIIKVVAKVYKKQKNFELVIVGDGKDRSKLENLASKLGILNKAVFFKGLKLSKELVVEFQQSNFFVLFSNYENLPCVVIEAMATGLPVIVSRIGGTPEHITKDMGVIV